MNVLSLFDGMSCGQVALERAGFQVTRYYASEIDKHAIAITQKNYPNTIQLGDVTQIRYKDGILYAGEVAFNVGKIDLLIGGSPCQGFSFAGKQLNFSDPRSKLFFELVRLRDEINPTYFLLENVKMKKEYLDVISQNMGVQPIFINSALVSAQNRQRYYWTNIPGVTIPQDRGVLLKDILETGYTDKEKAYCLTATYHFADVQNYFIKKERQRVFLSPFTVYPIPEGVRYQVTGESIEIKPAMGAKGNWENLMRLKIHTRKLNPVECERLQTLPDGYSDGVAATNRYRIIGNAWTIDVIAHIFSAMRTSATLNAPTSKSLPNTHRCGLTSNELS